MKLRLLLLLLLLPFIANAQTLYSKAFGNSARPALILMHGGPGSNSFSFEYTTAQRLADSGFYVIVYDRRGEGRSTTDSAQYTFAQTFNDLLHIYAQYHVQKAHLIGFSFGGIVATRFTEKYPERVQSLLLVSSLVSLQETYNTILRSCRKLYAAKHDTAGLRQLAVADKLDHRSIEFRNACFTNGSRNGFFSTPHPDSLAQQLYKQMDASGIVIKRSDDPGLGFWKNEHYTGINILPELQKLRAGKRNIYALYGKDDGLYSPQQVMAVRQVVGEDRLLYLDNASHSLFIDRQDAFVSAVTKWLR